jgi:hypothetical protein
MRAREFIVERKDFLPSQKAAIPGMQKFPQLDNSNPYHMWRFIVAAAGQGQNPNDTTEPARALELDGPIGQKLNTVTYSSADKDILDATAKSLGLEIQQVSSQPSEEPKFVQNVSPIKAFKGYPR